MSGSAKIIPVLERLTRSLRREAARSWLFTPNPLLWYQKPAELLREGRYREALGAVDQLAEGVIT